MCVSLFIREWKEAGFDWKFGMPLSIYLSIYLHLQEPLALSRSRTRGVRGGGKGTGKEEGRNIAIVGQREEEGGRPAFLLLPFLPLPLFLWLRASRVYTPPFLMNPTHSSVFKRSLVLRQSFESTIPPWTVRWWWWWW